MNAVEVTVALHDTVHFLELGVLRKLTAVVLLLYGLSIGGARRHLVALQHFEVRATLVPLMMLDRAGHLALLIPCKCSPS